MIRLKLHEQHTLNNEKAKYVGHWDFNEDDIHGIDIAHQIADYIRSSCQFFAGDTVTFAITGEKLSTPVPIIQCKKCQFWRLNRSAPGTGLCQLAESKDGKPQFTKSKATAFDVKRYQANLTTLPDFGCNQGKAKETP